MSNSYKSIKEDFVSNLTGGSIGEINLVVGSLPIAYFLWSALQSTRGFFQRSNVEATLIDFLLNIGTPILATTLYADSLYLLIGLLVAPACILITSPPSKRPAERIAKPAKKDGQEVEQMSDFPIRPFLTTYRGGLLVITCLCILAVDFRAYPRRFAKVETWGTSLMDLGVGSFVFSGGVVAAKGPLRDRKKLQAGKKKSVFACVPQDFLASLRHALPLLVLGFARLYSVKNLDYAEHVSEYGVHWNFFFTVGLLPIFLSLLSPIFSILPGPSFAITGLLLTTIYEVLLQFTNLKVWVLTAPRTSLLTQNKEGIVSSIGYLSIFLLGMETGMLILPRTPPSTPVKPLANLLVSDRNAKSPAFVARITLIVTLLVSSIFYSLLYVPFSAPYLFRYLAINTSRRLANAPYVFWVAAFNTGQLAVCALIETAFFPNVYRASTPAAEKAAASAATSTVVSDFNANGLLIFLAANLGTGAVNLGLDTLKIQPVPAVGILIVYMAALAGLARVTRGTKIKL